MADCNSRFPDFGQICCIVAFTNRLLQGPSCLVADSEGSVLIVDSHNHRIQLINPDFTFAAMMKVIERNFTLENVDQGDRGHTSLNTK